MAGTDSVDVVVVGAGVVGLACAAALAERGRSVLIFERGDGIAREASSRNSQVIHAGLYYPPGSVKAEFCATGREMLYERCERRRIPHRRIGKLVVATEPCELGALEALAARARSNGVPGLRLIDAAEVARLEPQVRAMAALHSPATGIVDAQALASSYLAEAQECGAQLLLRSEVVELVRSASPGAGTAASWEVSIDGPAGREAVRCAAIVNAAGLASDRIARQAGLDVDSLGLRLHPCKGDYFALVPGASLVLNRLVYPLPGSHGLGVHATIDLAGQIRFGPDAEFVTALDYLVDVSKTDAFAKAIARYLPGIEARWLAPDSAGIRARLAGPGDGFRDFVVREESDAGYPGLVSCIGIESPGLTAAGAIAARVADLVASI